MMQALIWLHILGLFGTGIWLLVVYAKENTNNKKAKNNKDQ